MSVSSARKGNKHKSYKNSSVPSPGFFEDDVGKLSKTGSVKRVRRIRRTNDMICLDIAEHENNYFKNKTNESPRKSSPLAKINEFASPFLEDTSIKSTIKKLQVTSAVTNNLSPEFPTKKAANATFFDDKFVTFTTIPETSEPKKPTEKRKIVKARRFFKNYETQDQTNKQEHESATVENTTVDAEITFTEQETQQTHEVWVEDEEHCSMTEMKKKSLNLHGMMVKTLPSPIAPSESSIEMNTNLSTISQHLQFNSSTEELHPSTSGNVKAIKRRTYELEDSVTDISLLKSASAQDCTRINSFPSSDDTDYKTPSKVTMRRKWNKPEHFSAHWNGSPRWVNNESQKKSCSFSENVNKQKLQKAVTTSKKFVSKVKIPNFAAIHTRALERIESITEYKQRKDDRAKMLLSGLKPKYVEKSSSKKESGSAKKSSGKKERRGVKKLSSKKESRKQLRFAPDTSLKEKSPTFIPLPSTPLPKKMKHVMESPMTPRPDESKKFNFVFAKESAFVESPVFKQHNVEEKVSPVKSCCQEYVKKFNFVFSKENKFTQIPVLKQNNVEKKVLTVKNCNIKEAFKGFSKVTNEVQRNLIKSIVTKSKPVSNTLQLRRCTIKGVRSNRRFELLMNMRKGK